MISENYTTGKTEKQGKYTFKRKPSLVFGNKPCDIENWEEALYSEEMYVPHHWLECWYSTEELIKMNMYWEVPAWQLIWIKENKHNGSTFLHAENRKMIGRKRPEHSKLMSGRKREDHSKFMKEKWKLGKYVDNLGRTWSEFGRKFYEHYGIHRSDNYKLYKREMAYYRNHNHKCRWE